MTEPGVEPYADHPPHRVRLVTVRRGFGMEVAEVVYPDPSGLLGRARCCWRGGHWWHYAAGPREARIYGRRCCQCGTHQERGRPWP